MTPATKNLIKLLIEQEYGHPVARPGYMGRDSGDPERSPEEELKMIRDWMSQLGLLMDDMRRKGYGHHANQGEAMAKILRNRLRDIKSTLAFKAQKERHANKPHGRIPGVNDIPRPNKKPKPAL